MNSGEFALACLEELIPAAKRGETLQRRAFGSASEDWDDLFSDDWRRWDFTKNYYRVRPGNKTVELSRSDIKPGTWVRCKEDGDALLVLVIGERGVYVVNNHLSYAELQKRWFGSTDLAHWEACEKEG